ncbi:MAG: hypothetical protein U0414_40410 [Polyangiaceae bacterium]
MSAYSVTFLGLKGDGSGLSGSGSIGMDGTGVRVVGTRARRATASCLAGAAVLGVAGAGLFALFTVDAELTAGIRVAAVVLASPLLLVMFVLARLALVRGMSRAKVDRVIPFPAILKLEASGDWVELVTTARGFGGSTWLLVDGGAEEKSRLLDEYQGATSGRGGGYR